MVVVIVALRPFRFRQWRVLTIPGALILVRGKRAFHRVGAGIAKRFIQPADAVVRGCDKHQITRRPRVEVSMRKDAGHAKLGHLRNVVPTDHLPLIGQDRIEPGVVRTIADRIVVKVGN